ncbi:MAG: LacI family DNA-binding transcriptional regulator [Lachnospiraceae bacterium]|nr:LacI family DNA-binding transcriptional regulator [Lachnospiraceae bacterium]
MENTRVRIVDIAEELGLSTATVSNVIHGKTKKISDETVKRVQQLLEERQYIPSMAGILLAQNDSRIIGVVINNHEKYEGHVLEDPFVASSLNNLSVEIEQSGYFMMVKTTTDLKDIVKFASMWNLEGIIIIGFCEDEYNKLREFMRVPFVVYDGYFENKGRVCNLTIENFNGGVQMGEYFRNLGHEKALYLSDNMICVDLERYQGFCQGFGTEHVESWSIPMQKHSRHQFYEEHFGEISKYTAVFAASDYYAIDFMQFVMAKGIRVPEDISVSGFDDNPICEQVVPSLTSVRQDGRERAREALSTLQALKQGEKVELQKELSVSLVMRNSTAKCTKK